MNPFTQLDGLVAPLDRANVDTDAIIPKQFLKSIKRSGFGPNAFDEWRYLDVGQPGQDNSQRPLNPDFVLNQARYQGAQILLTRDNFGCGSSREHAPVAIRAAGVSCVVAASFARIFYRNAFNTGLPIVVCPQAAREIEAGDRVRVDVVEGRIDDLTTGKTYAAEVYPPFMRELVASGGLLPYVKRRLAQDEV